MIGLIVSTYKSPDFLNLVLESVDRQKLSPDEIIVTEDGRLEANRTVISEWQKRLAKKPGAPALIHLSQEDLGN